MGQFDQTARPLAKGAGASFFGWILSRCASAPKLTFLRWDDTRRLVVPGEPDRTNDLLALLQDKKGREVWLIVEIETEPEQGILYRMGQYEILLGKEVNPLCDPKGPAVGSVILNLSGVQKTQQLACSWGSYGTRLAPFVVDAAVENANITLDKICRGELGLTISPLLALMNGGGRPEFIRRWRQAVDAEQDLSRRAQYREAAFVFAELTAFQVNWIRGLEDWVMPRESQYIKSWEKVGEDRARLERNRAFLLKALRRLEDPVPDPIRMAVEGTNDLDTLERWFDAALDAKGIAEMRKTMQLES